MSISIEPNIVFNVGKQVQATLYTVVAIPIVAAFQVVVSSEKHPPEKLEDHAEQASMCSVCSGSSGRMQIPFLFYVKLLPLKSLFDCLFKFVKCSTWPGSSTAGLCRFPKPRPHWVEPVKMLIDGNQSVVKSSGQTMAGSAQVFALIQDTAQVVH